MANAMITSKASKLRLAEFLTKSDEETLDYVRDFGSHSSSCRFGGVFMECGRMRSLKFSGQGDSILGSICSKWSNAV